MESPDSPGRFTDLHRHSPGGFGRRRHLRRRNDAAHGEVARGSDHQLDVAPGQGTLTDVTAIQPELWVDRGLAALAFYERAFGAQVLHRTGEGEDIVAQLAVDDAVFWIAVAGDSSERLVPRMVGAASARLLLVVSDPQAVHSRAIAAGAVEKSVVGLEHGWQLGRIIDPFGHEWEIGRPVIDWPPIHPE